MEETTVATEQYTQPPFSKAEDAFYSSVVLTFLMLAAIVGPTLDSLTKMVKEEIDEFRNPKPVKAPPPFDWKGTFLKCFVFMFAFPVVLLMGGDMKELRHTINEMA